MEDSRVVFARNDLEALDHAYIPRELLACSRPSVSGSVRRAAGERGKNEEGLGREDGASPLAPALSP